ncbi:MAG: hypothetical protein WA885_14525 [Phormidesmis sp.]
MKPSRLTAHAFVAVMLLTATAPALAQANVSDITGPNVSDITGPNVSDITGPNTSDITGPNTSDITGTDTSNGARRAVAAGLSQEDIDELAEQLGAAYAVCASGGDCTAFSTLLERSSYILDGE